MSDINDCIEKCILCAVKPDGTKAPLEVSLIKEHSLTVYLNGENAFSLVCTDELLNELVIGRLCTEGIIKSRDDICEISFDESRERADVILKSEKALNADAPSEKLDWSAEQIFSLAESFAKGMPIHSKTQGTHSCILARGSEVLFSCEDIGRHNTVDKAVGYAIVNGIKLSECILFISGRVPVDMMNKVINSGIQVLVSKSVPTADAVRLAEKHGVTLIVKAYPDQIEICE